MSIKAPQSVDIFKGSTLIVGREGADLEKTVKPESSNLTISNRDQFGLLRAIPLRRGGSDVVITNEGGLAANVGFDAQAHHYARNGGEISISTTSAELVSYTVAGYDGRVLTLRDANGLERRLDTDNDVTVKWGKVEPAWQERRTPTWNIDLANVDAKDALTLRADVNSAARIDYRIVLDEADGNFDQHKITAQLRPRATISNGTDVPFTDLSVNLKLNEPRAGRNLRGGPMLERAYAFDAAAVEGVSEGEASGVIVMPIRNGGVNLAPGETRVLNFAAAVNGTPNDDSVKTIAITLDQSLNLGFNISPDKKLGIVSERKGSPSSTFELSSTKEARPAGRYEIYEEGQLAGPAHNRASYTRGGDCIDIPGNMFTAVRATSSFKTNSFTSGQPQPVEGRIGYQQVTNQFGMEYSLSLDSTSKVDRDVDVKVSVHAFSNLGNIKAKIGDQDLVVTYDEGMLSFKVPIKAEGKAAITITFDGEQVETRRN